MMKLIKIREYERGLLYRNGRPVKLLTPGWHVGLRMPVIADATIERFNVRDPWVRSTQLDVLVKSGLLDGLIDVVDLSDGERAIVWVDDRLDAVLGPGLYALWNGFKRVRVDRYDAADLLLDRKDLTRVLADASARAALTPVNVSANSIGLLFRDGELAQTLKPGQYAYWTDVARVRVVEVDLREKALDVGGQEIMTADKVTLRLNALATYRVVDAAAAVTRVEAFDQALYRQAQLALRESVGSRSLDDLLSGKESIETELKQAIAQRASSFGVEVSSVGLRDVILPGEMKVLLNRVTEAKKAAEANLITRREEIAAARSQANTARILEANPVLMRLKELEVLEKVANNANLNVLVGEKGLADKVVKLL